MERNDRARSVAAIMQNMVCWGVGAGGMLTNCRQAWEGVGSEDIDAEAKQFAQEIGQDYPVDPLGKCRGEIEALARSYILGHLTGLQVCELIDMVSDCYGYAY